MSIESHQSLRGFVSTLERAHPDAVLRIAEPVDQAYQMQALALELERRRRFPVLLFEQVRGHSIPVVSNVMASRRGLAAAPRSTWDRCRSRPTSRATAAPT